MMSAFCMEELEMNEEKVSMFKKFESDTDDLMSAIIKYIEGIPSGINTKQIDDIKDKLLWVKDYFEINANIDYLHKEPLPDLLRSEVILIKLGENLGMEFSGDHPGIVIRNSKMGSNQVFVLPLTTQKPDGYNPTIVNIYMEIGIIPYLTGFRDITNPNHPDTGKHWANILNVKSISRNRIYYPPHKTSVNGMVMDKISIKLSTHVALISKNNIIKIKKDKIANKNT
jgi:uncharacterized protein YifN (PemK superfamily)